MLAVDDVDTTALRELAARYSATIEVIPKGEAIPGSFWGESEAGLVNNCVYVRSDTPVHSFLHEFCHFICMDDDRRDELDTDAGGDDLEEAAVCYLQVLLAAQLPGVGRDRLMADMDEWGYSFRLGSTARWFSEDAEDAREWLHSFGIVDADDRLTGNRRSATAQSPCGV